MNSKLMYELPAVLSLLALATLVNYWFASHLGLTGIVIVYLVLVVVVTHRFRFPFGLVAAASAFLTINYFFIHPVYTWEIADLESWAALIGFLLVSVVISSLIKKLQQESQKSENARKRAEFAKSLAEQIAAATDLHALLDGCCRLMHDTFQRPVAIAQSLEHRYVVTHQAGTGNCSLNQNAINWVADSGKILGPGTSDWAECNQWIVPFERRPGNSPILLIGEVNETDRHIWTDDLRAVADQLSNAYQRLLNTERARQAELQAHRESIQNTLLASISHDMRTPLTGIIGTASTLREQGAALSPDDVQILLDSIIKESEQLAVSTENILSLVQLESENSVPVHLDWQSPEEIVGVVIARYCNRGLGDRIVSEIHDNTSLIKGNATLLTQALVNLVDNALAVQPDSEPIVLAVHRENDRLGISVMDRGDGFPEGFDTISIGKFARHRKNQGGFGLGLAIVAAVARKHQAEFHIAPRPGGGTCVTLSFQADFDERTA